MLGEAARNVYDLTDELQDLREQRELFIYSNQDVMNEWAYEKKLKEFDERIEELEDSLEGAQMWYDELLERESYEYYSAQENEKMIEEAEVQEMFDEMAKVEGVSNEGFDWE